MLFRSMDVMDGANPTIKRLAKSGGLRIGKCLSSQYGLIGRGTAVYEVEADEDLGDLRDNLVVKFSWQPRTRQNESAIIEEARKVGNCQIHLPEVYATAVSWKHTLGEGFYNVLMDDPLNRHNEEYVHRELRIIIERKYKLLKDVNDPAVFWEIISQILKCA